MSEYHLLYADGVLFKNTSVNRTYGICYTNYTISVVMNTSNDTKMFITRDWITRFILREFTGDSIYSYYAVKIGSELEIPELDLFMDELKELMIKLQRGEDVEDQLVIDYYNEAERYARILKMFADELYEESKKRAAEINFNRQSKMASN